MNQDDDDDNGGGTMIMVPDARGPSPSGGGRAAVRPRHRSPQLPSFADPASDANATKVLGPEENAPRMAAAQSYGQPGMPQLNARRDPTEFTPSATAPIGLMRPDDLARSLPQRPNVPAVHQMDSSPPTAILMDPTAMPAQGYAQPPLPQQQYGYGPQGYVPQPEQYGPPGGYAPEPQQAIAPQPTAVFDIPPGFGGLLPPEQQQAGFGRGSGHELPVPPPNWNQPPLVPQAPEFVQVQPRKPGAFPFIVGALIASGLIATVLVVVLASRSSGPSVEPKTVELPVAVEATAPEPIVASPTATVSTTAAAVPAPTGAEAEAIAALEKLKTGVETCIKQRIKQLPGVSAPVPATFNHFKNGPYKPTRRDFIAPFYSCTRFSVDTPMPYMIQWQVTKRGAEGAGVAWVDADSDGKPEKAYAFTCKYGGPNAVELGPIEEVPADRKIQRAN